jgi:hypothetical protein
MWRQDQLKRTFGGWPGSQWVDQDCLAAMAAKTFASFDMLRQIEAYEKALAFAKEPKGNLLFRGDYGVGKSVAATELLPLAEGRRIAAKNLIERGFELLTLVEGKPIPVRAHAEFNALETVHQIQTKSGRHVTRNGDHPFGRAMWARCFE